MGLHYDAGFLSRDARAEILSWLGTLQPLSGTTAGRSGPASGSSSSGSALAAAKASSTKDE